MAITSGGRRLLRWFAQLGAVATLLSPCFASETAQIVIGYLREPHSKIRISQIDVPAENDGLAGALLAIDDDNTTGRFTGQSFSLVESGLDPDQRASAALDELAEKGVGFVIADLDAPALLRAADAARARNVVLLNIRSTDDRLRQEDCRSNVIHVAPSRGMLADGLAQYLVWRKWRRWFLISGSHEADKLFADALRRSAGRFGAKIVAEREYVDAGGARRTDSGLTDIQREMPLLTQGAPDYDVLVAADESEVFAGYLPYRTWDPRPVAGSAGLVPTSWDAAFDQWGAIQLQSRFFKAYHRSMSALDMQGWTAARMIGEAATRTSSTQAERLVAYLLSADFSVAAFKGQMLTLRDWDRQLRQPILLFDGRNTVSVSPQEGFLHPASGLDTLGFDRPESKCKLK
jgi:ABC transporter substrate binding protein (PQQ-dependent alcohol dehydrogenase system)